MKLLILDGETFDILHKTIHIDSFFVSFANGAVDAITRRVSGPGF